MNGLIKGLEVTANIKSARVRKGLTQKEAADLLGVTPTTYNSWENRPENLTLEKFKKMAEAYGVSVSYFFGL